MNITMEQLIFSALLATIIFMLYLLIGKVLLSRLTKKVIKEITNFYKRKEITNRRIEELKDNILRGLDNEKELIKLLEIKFLSNSIIDIQIKFEVFIFTISGGFHYDLSELKSIKKNYEESYLEFQSYCLEHIGKKVIFLPDSLNSKAVDFNLVYEIDLESLPIPVVEELSSKMYRIIFLIMNWHEGISEFNNNQWSYDLMKLNKILMKLHSMNIKK